LSSGFSGKTEETEEALIVVVPSPLPVSQDFSSPKKKTRIEILKGLLFYTCFGHNKLGFVQPLFAAYNKKRLAAFSHGVHQDLKVGDNVTIYSVVNNSPYEVKVFQVDRERDYVLLECDKELFSIEFDRAKARNIFNWVSRH
jgi:hypothetical protein